MVTFQYVIFAHQQRKDKSFPVKIRVTYKRKSKYLATNIIAQPSDLTRSLSVKSQSIKKDIDNLVVSLEDIISRANYSELLGWDVDDVVSFIKKELTPRETFRLDFIAYGHRRAEEKPKGTSIGYDAALNALCRFTGSETLDISAISVKFLRQFEEHLKNEPSMRPKLKTEQPKGDRAISAYLAAIRHIFNLARQEFNNPDTGEILIPNNPFEYYKVPQQKPAEHRNIEKDVIQKMIDSEPHLKGRQRFAVDAFLISFCLFGMNATDLYDCKKASKGIITYNRNKTEGRKLDKALVKVRIEPCIKSLIKEYEDIYGERQFKFHRMYANNKNFSRAINEGLKAWTKENKEEHFTMYSARHSFATIANSSLVGIDKQIINDCLVHADRNMKTTDIYIAKDWNVHWNANVKLLSIFDWTPLKTGR